MPNVGVNWNGSVGGSLGGASWQPQVGGGPYDRSGVSGPQGPDPTLEDAARQRPQGPQYFGYHNDSSILARLAQQGVAPTPVNLRIAQQMLRYGLPISPEMIAQLRQLWQAMGASSLVDLEALIALFSSGLPADQTSLQAMLQLLSGGPASHLLARLTMALKQQGQGLPQLDALKALLTSYWKLGNGPEAFPKEIGQFQQIMNQLRTLLDAQLAAGLDKLPRELASELMSLRQLFQAQTMLQRVPGSTLYIPFFQWRDQHPMPGEFLVETERDPIQKAAQYTHLTVCVDTRNLGRLTLDFTALRGHLAVRFEVQDQPVKKALESQLPSFQRRLAPSTGYIIAGLKVEEVGQGRSISVLLPKRRDVRKLGRAIGVI